MAVERRDPAVSNDYNKKGGKGDMTKTPISLQDLRRSLYIKAKAEPSLAFLGTIRPHLQNGDASGSLLDGKEE
jgi:hypothetical protein